MNIVYWMLVQTYLTVLHNIKLNKKQTCYKTNGNAQK